MLESIAPVVASIRSMEEEDNVPLSYPYPLPPSTLDTNNNNRNNYNDENGNDTDHMSVSHPDVVPSNSMNNSPSSTSHGDRIEQQNKILKTGRKFGKTPGPTDFPPKDDTYVRTSTSRRSRIDANGDYVHTASSTYGASNVQSTAAAVAALKWKMESRSINVSAKVCPSVCLSVRPCV